MKKIAPAYVFNQCPMNTMNIVSAAQFLDNGSEFTLNEHSASFLKFRREKTFVLDYQKHIHWKFH